MQTREDESDGTEHEPSTRASRHAQHLFAIDGEVIAQHSKAEAEEHHVDANEPTTLEEEAVEAKGRSLNFEV